MSFIIKGIAREVFERLNNMYESSKHGGNIFYEGIRHGQDTGGVTVARIEILAEKMGDLPVKRIKARPLDPVPSQALYNHSPDGFEWGYYGSGPAQLALALILDATGDKVYALKYHQEYKEKFVAGWGMHWHTDANQIKRWVKLRRFHEQFKEANAGEGDITVY